MKMFSLTLIAVLGAFLLGKTECAINGWTSGGGTTAMQDVTDTSCASVAEGGTVSFTVTATTDASSITGYAIQTQPSGTTGTYVFAVSSAGAVSLSSGTPDYEADTSLVVVIRATDDGSSSGDLTCTLTVTDVTEAAPDFNLNSGCLAYDSLAASATITTVTVTAVASQPVTLSKASGDSGNDFSYTAATGALAVGGSAVTSGTYTLIFNAVDNASPAQTGTSTLIIKIGSSTTCSSSAMVMMVSAYLFLATLLAFLG